MLTQILGRFCKSPESRSITSPEETIFKLQLSDFIVGPGKHLGDNRVVNKFPWGSCKTSKLACKQCCDYIASYEPWANKWKCIPQRLVNIVQYTKPCKPNKNQSSRENGHRFGSHRPHIWIPRRIERCLSLVDTMVDFFSPCNILSFRLDTYWLVADELFILVQRTYKRFYPIVIPIFGTIFHDTNPAFFLLEVIPKILEYSWGNIFRPYHIVWLSDELLFAKTWNLHKRIICVGNNSFRVRHWNQNIVFIEEHLFAAMWAVVFHDTPRRSQNVGKNKRTITSVFIVLFYILSIKML